MALTYAVLRDHRSLNLVEAETRETCRRAYLTALALNLVRLRTLDEILAEARIRSLKVVVIKGGLLGRTHYGDPGARPMVDLDLVCDPGDVQALVEVTHRLGFRTHQHPERRVVRNATHDVQVSNGSMFIEIHFRLWHELRIDNAVRGLIQRAHEVPFGTDVAYAPDPADHLYLVLVHAAMHGFTGNPLWLTDALLLATSAGDRIWERTRELARAARAELALAAARDHLALVFPDLVPELPSGGSLRRSVLKKWAPRLQRGERELGSWPSRIVRALLFERPGPFADWATDKAKIWLDDRIETLKDHHGSDSRLEAPASEWQRQAGEETSLTDNVRRELHGFCERIRFGP